MDAPFVHHNASAQVFEEAPGRCRFVWSADVLPHELGDFVDGLIEQGLRVIKKTLEEATSASGSGHRQSSMHHT